MRFQEGNTLGGRTKGSKNKLNLDIKNVFDNVFDKMGGEEALFEWARGHKGRFYEIWARMLPKKLQASVEHTHEDFIRYLQEEEAKRLEQIGKPLKLIEAETGNTPINIAVNGVDNPQNTHEKRE